MRPAPSIAHRGQRPHQSPGSAVSLRPGPAAWLPPLVLLLAMVALVGLALIQLTPPAAVPATAPITVFSAERAMRDLTVIARSARPTGSPAHAATRQYLIDQLTAMGLAPEVQSTVGVTRFPGNAVFLAGSVQNVVVRLPGAASTGAIALDAHYDGASTGPGASDCGACVATLLETLRALRAGPPLRNDVIAVFADAEENGDVGAAGFMGNHPWARDVRLALNFEGYATGGPSFLFATSRQNGWLIDQFLSVAPQPTGSSLFVALMGIEPGSGMDLEEYMARGAAGLDFTYANYATAAYHSAGDTAAAVDPRGLQHDGNYALALVRHFGGVDLAALPRTPDAVFFNVLPGVVARYPQPWALPLAVVVAALFLSMLVAGFWRRRLTAGGLVVGSLAFLVGAIGVFALITLIWMAIKALNPNYQVVLVGTYQGPLFLAAFAALALGGMATLYAWLRAHVRLTNLAAGALLSWAILMLLTAAAAPGASYLFTWPLLFALLGLGWALMGDQAERPWRSVAALVLAAAPGVLLVTLAATNPLFPMMTRLEMMSRLPLSVAPALLVALLAELLVPQLALLAGDAGAAAPSGRRRWLAPMTALVIGLALIAVANLRSGFDAQHPRPNSIAYQLDADTGQARWLSADPAPDAWTRQFFPDAAAIRPGERFPTLGLPAFAAPAPAVALPAPTVVVREDSTDGSLRTLRLRLVSPRHAQNLAAEIQADGMIAAATLDGLPLDLSAFTTAQRQRLAFTYVNPPEPGIELALRIASAGPLVLHLQDASAGLPPIPGMTIAARPPEMMPIPGPTLLDPTVVRRSITMPAR